jgi:hypothetical protein
MTDLTFNPIYLDQVTNITSRQIITQLPDVHQTPTLQRFFNASINSLFNPGQGQQINGYVGEYPNYYDPTQDFYLIEPTTSRQFYQLEPSMVCKDQTGNIISLLFYPDIVNQLRFQGAIVNNHDRLFEQNYYSWCPPINPDKLINYREYYWLEVNDLQPDYMVIAPGCIDGNPWSVNNLWNHIDDLTTSQVAQATQATRPIIEFQTNLELFNYGTIRRAEIFVVANSIDLLNLVATVNNNASAEITIDGVTITQSTGTIRVLAINDKTITINNEIFSLSFNTSGSITLLLETDGINVNGGATTGEICYVSNGNIYGNKEVYFNGVDWVVAQQKTNVNQAPYFNLYDTNQIILNDPLTYPNSTFNGNQLFNYATSSTGANDVILGFPLSFDSNGQIYFENYLSSETYSYLNVSTNTVTNIPGFYYHQMQSDSGNIFGNDWYPVSVVSRQMMVDQYVCDGVNQVFQISQFPDENVAGRAPNISVSRTFASTSSTASYTTEILIQNTDYFVLPTAIVLATSNSGDLLQIKTYSSTGPFADATGFYQVAPNLSQNPDNAEVNLISSGDCYAQFSEILENQIGFSGEPYFDNNWENTLQDRSLGREIVQNTANLLNLSLTLSESNLDFMNSARYVEVEYMRFRNKFEQQITNFYQNGKSQVDTTTSTWVNQWINDALKILATGKTQTFPFAYSGMAVTTSNTIQNFIPGTPSYLGVYPISIPAIVLDLTLETQYSGQIAYPQMMIQNHDGSLTPTYGQYQLNFDGSITPLNGIADPRDQVILALESRIYSSIAPTISARERPDFDFHQFYSSYWKQSDYSYAEYLSLLQPAFDRWIAQYSLDFRTNSTFVQADPFTWNWSQVQGLDGNQLPGHWRGIALYYYDTDRPHTNPWEMLGFANQPDYWAGSYGPAPYTSNNLMMWQDLENGYIVSGSRAGINPQWARPGLSKIIPVDEEGNLLDPVQMGIATYYPPSNFAKQNWSFGDSGPVETAWRRTSLFPFAVAEAGYLMKPARFFGSLWDSGNNLFVNGQYVDASTFNRPQHAEVYVHGEPNTNGDIVIKFGIQQWISDYVMSLNQNVQTSFGNLVRGLGVQLAYKMAGFTDSTSLSFTSDAFDLVPAEDSQVQLYQSPSIREEFYSGVIINYDGNVFTVYGYNIANPYFLTIPPNIFGPASSISVSSGSQIVVPNWKPNTYYLADTTVNYAGTYYVCVTTYTSAQVFEPRYWNQIAVPTFTSSISVAWYSSADTSTATSVQYGTQFQALQDVANFLNGLERYYIAQGWSFELITSDNVISNWSNSCLQFLTWFKANQTSSNVFIALSPGSNQLTFATTQGEPQSIEQFVNGTYSLVDRQSKPINPSNVDIARLDGQLIATPTSNVVGGIFGCSLYICEIEHVAILDNLTIFNDTIYNPLLNVRQPRLRLQGFKTTNWQGRINAPGFIVSNNVLIPNYEKAADNFRHFFDIETIDDGSLQERARFNAGYAPRGYLTNLLLTPTNQFEFYQGMIQQKGTPAVMNRLLRSNFIRNNQDIEFLEEWAFRVGDYGTSQVKPSFDLQLKQSDVATDPQLITFTVGTTAPSYAADVIQITDLTNPLTGLITSRDPRWIWRQIFAQMNWNQKQFPQNTPGFLPNTGYVDINEVSWFAQTQNDFLLLYNSALVTNPSNSISMSYTFNYDGIDTNPANLKVVLIPNLTTGFLRIDEIQVNVTQSFIQNSMTINIGRSANTSEFAQITSAALELGQNTIYMPSSYFELTPNVDNTIYIEFNYLGLAALGANVGVVTITINAEQFISSILPNQRALVYNDVTGGWKTYKLQDTGATVITAYVPSFSGQGTPIVLDEATPDIRSTDYIIIDGVESGTGTSIINNTFTSVYNPITSNISRVVISPTVLAAATITNGFVQLPLLQMIAEAGMTIDSITINVVTPFTGGTVAPQFTIGSVSNTSEFVAAYTPLSQFVANNPQLSVTPSFATGNPVSIDIYDTVVSVAEGTNYVPLQIVRSGNIYYNLASISVTNPGSGYSSAPAVTVSNPPGVQAVASLAGGVSQILVTNGGSGYTGIPIVTVTGGGGNGATATASIAAGAVSAITVRTAGGAYTSPPTIVISGGAGVGASATATVNYGVSGVVITSNGNCTYNGSSTPTVTFSGGGGTGATATANLTSQLPAMVVNWQYMSVSPTSSAWVQGSPVTFPPIGTTITAPVLTPKAGGFTNTATTGYWLQTIYVPVSNPETENSTYQVQIYDPITNDTNYIIGQNTSTITVVKTGLDSNSVDLTTAGTTVVSGGPAVGDEVLTAYLAANSNSGTVIINVNYHYGQGFEVFNLDGTPNVITNSGEGGRILGWYPTRFANLTNLNSAEIPNGWIDGDIAEVDFVGNVLTAGGWGTYQFNGVTKTWNQIRSETLKVDSRQFVNATIYNQLTNETLQTLQIFDPYQGLIVGTADREISYKVSYDPAIYNTSSDSSIPTNPQACWGLNQLGQLWWDLSTVRYIDYNIGTSNYKWQNWGDLAPDITIDIYEWVRSPVAPSLWANYLLNNNLSTYIGFATTPQTGTVNTDNSYGWVQQQEWIPALNRNVTAYYFWVQNVASVPPVPFRQLTALQVASIIQDPTEQDIPWFAAINSNQLIVSGIQQYLDDTNTVLSLSWNIDDNDGNQHKQWKIIREGDITTTIDDSLWDKLRDSLVGWDTFKTSISASSTLTAPFTANSLEISLQDASQFAQSGDLVVNSFYIPYTWKNGNTLYGITNTYGITSTSGSTITQLVTTDTPNIVPDPLLTAQEASGNLYRPRQSWFPPETNGSANRYARQIFVQAFNTLMQDQPYLDNWYEWQDTMYGTDQAPDSSLYNYSATSYTIRDQLAADGAIEIGQTVFVPGYSASNNFWTLWLYNGINTSSDLPDFTLINAQRFQFKNHSLVNQPGDFWYATDWYASGWNSSDFPLYHFDSYDDFLANSGSINTTLYMGTLVMIDHQSATDTRWSWEVFLNGQWTEVAKQNGTVALSESFYDPTKIIYGFGTITPADLDNILNRDGSFELQYLLNQIADLSLFTELQMNTLYFAMTRCAMSLNDNIDWAIKTSFMTIGGYSEPLTQEPLAYASQIDNITSYIQEVKPYHVTIREYFVQYTVGPDIVATHVTDFDSGYATPNVATVSVVNLPSITTSVNLAIDFPSALAQAQSDAAAQTAAQVAAQALAVSRNQSATTTTLTPFQEVENINVSTWNGLRHSSITILFDRTSCSESSTSGWDLLSWDYFTGQYVTNTTPGNPQAGLLLGTDTINTVSQIHFNENVEVEIPSEWDEPFSDNAANRIYESYVPLSNMKQLNDPSLISGCDYRGFIQDGGPLSYGLWDDFAWDVAGGFANEAAYYDGSPDDLNEVNTYPNLQPPGENVVLTTDYRPGDLDIDGMSFSFTAAQQADELVDVDGGQFSDPLVESGHPEELVSLVFVSTLLISLNQKDQAGNITNSQVFNEQFFNTAVSA